MKHDCNGKTRGDCYEEKWIQNTAYDVCRNLHAVYLQYKRPRLLPLSKRPPMSAAANVGWKSPKVKIFRGNAQYAVRISDRGRRDAEIRVRKLRKGIVYHYTISGIRKAGDRKYTTIRGSFMA